jgi:hypothetical protein
MCVQRNVVARSRNHCCNRNTAMRSVCFVELHITVNNMKYWGLHKNVLWRFYVTADNYETYLGIHAKCPTFLSDFSQVLSFSVREEQHLYAILINFNI